MKNTKICPKCGGNNIYIKDGSTEMYGSGNNISTGKTLFSTVKVNRYICCDCGYIEEWVNKEDLEKIEKSNKIHKLI